MNTAPFMLSGTYAVHYAFDAPCFYGGFLERADGEFSFNDVGSGTGPVEGDTNLYNLEAADYYINMITGPAPGCPWTVTFTPQ